MYPRKNVDNFPLILLFLNIFSYLYLLRGHVRWRCRYLRPHLDVVRNGREKWPEGLNLVAQVEGVGLEQGHTLDLIFSLLYYTAVHCTTD